MDQRALRIEALKLIKDWSVWMVAVQTALIAFIGAGAGTTGGIRIPAWAANSTVALFAASILCAAWVLSGIPWIVVCLEGSPKKDSPKEDDQPDKDLPNIYHMKLMTFSILGCLPLWLMATLQHVFFVLGIIVLAVAVFYRQVPEPLFVAAGPGPCRSPPYRLGGV